MESHAYTKLPSQSKPDSSLVLQSPFGCSLTHEEHILQIRYPLYLPQPLPPKKYRSFVSECKDFLLRRRHTDANVSLTVLNLWLFNFLTTLKTTQTSKEPFYELHGRSVYAEACMKQATLMIHKEDCKAYAISALEQANWILNQCSQKQPNERSSKAWYWKHQIFRSRAHAIRARVYALREQIPEALEEYDAVVRESKKLGVAHPEARALLKERRRLRHEHTSWWWFPK
ncbi:hypothetical protein CROQUDRAFT_130412 [Cronartium quercuum f. sp. fusiforme G11]|uniref:Uncharacterized protein n=1 Tax=Cronartium quercuum f. sp. fusiforme G11 TaxID=708437 RepID=A0A9P6TGH3_9BASI|nr:hypothetical protein CROQUDRAFT_130412 [Cronartium quercuum f. sp. fusiforme G11]